MTDDELSSKHSRLPQEHHHNGLKTVGGSKLSRT